MLKYNLCGVIDSSNHVKLKIDNCTYTLPFPWWCMRCSSPPVIIARFKQKFMHTFEFLSDHRTLYLWFCTLLLHFFLLYSLQKIDNILTLCRVSFCSCYTPLLSIRHPKKIAFLSNDIAECRLWIGLLSGDGNSAPYAFNNLIYLHTSDGITAVNSALVNTWSLLYKLPGWRPWRNDMNDASTLL
jgi:hypothetical protein